MVRYTIHCGSVAMLCSAALLMPAKNCVYMGKHLMHKTNFICKMNLLLRGLFVDLGDGPANTLLNDMHRNRQVDSYS